jgi:ATP-dependent helicase HrpB
LPRSLPDLPVLQCLPELRLALSDGHAVLTAEPGSGKTTLVPLLLLDEPWLAGRKILMLEPRRPAARLAARRLALLSGRPLGEQVGYQVRFERRVSSQTRIEVLTEGLLVRRLQADPELPGVGLVIFDEFHERNLASDLAMALCMDVVRGLRDDLRLLVMSATLDPEPLCRLLPATTVNAPGRQFPVDVVQDGVDAGTGTLVERCAALVGRALDETLGDVLVFLPGRREIEALCARLTESLRGSGPIFHALYGDLDAAAQDRALSPDPGGRRRVIVATDIAESSLTIDGIPAVVDGGFARRPRFDPNSGLTRLETRRITRASAAQRAGRAGRLGPGRAYRAWTPARDLRLDARPVPEIREADLAPLALELANWGTAPDRLSWLDPPPASAWRQGLDLLVRLGAVARPMALTEQGRAMAALPLHPRLAHLLVAAPAGPARSRAVDLAAMLSEGDPVRGAARRSVGADLQWRLERLDDLRNRRELPVDVDRSRLRRIDRVARQLADLSNPAGRGDDSVPPGLGALLFAAYPDRLAQCTPGDGTRYRLRGGRAVILDATDPLAGAPYLVVADLDAGRRDGRVFLAAVIDAASLERLCANEISDERALRWDPGVGDVVARRVRRLDALVLRDEPVALEASDPVFAVLAEHVRSVGVGRVFDLPENLLARVALMRRLEPDADWPDTRPEGLEASLEDWLQPWLPTGGGLRALRQHPVETMLEAWLGHERVRYLATQLPSYYPTPAGTRRRIDYTADGGPVLALPMQELFGEPVGPAVADGRVSLLLHLLSPAGRPLQVTRDLGGFWRGAYDDVRKEMRGRYPKHFWPEDPTKATPGQSLKRRRRP